LSQEEQLLDQKSLRAATGKTADWNEIAQDCIAFANVVIATHGGQYIEMRIPRAMSVASTTDGRHFLRVADQSKPVTGDDAMRLASERYELPDGLYRQNVPAFDEIVIRELLVNALVHRPYPQRGDIFLNLHPDQLEMVNPGPLPLGVNPSAKWAYPRANHLSRQRFSFGSQPALEPKRQTKRVIGQNVPYRRWLGDKTGSAKKPSSNTTRKCHSDYATTLKRRPPSVFAAVQNKLH